MATGNWVKLCTNIRVSNIYIYQINKETYNSSQTVKNTKNIYKVNILVHNIQIANHVSLINSRYYEFCGQVDPK